MIEKNIDDIYFRAQELVTAINEENDYHYVTKKPGVLFRLLKNEISKLSLSERDELLDYVKCQKRAADTAIANKNRRMAQCVLKRDVCIKIMEVEAQITIEQLIADVVSLRLDQIHNQNQDPQASLNLSKKIKAVSKVRGEYFGAMLDKMIKFAKLEKKISDDKSKRHANAVIIAGRSIKEIANNEKLK